MSDESAFSNLDHIGVIVKDIDKAVKYYASLGIGPFKPLGPVERYDKKLWGKLMPSDSMPLSVRVARLGQTMIELIQPLSKEGPWNDFLETKGEGIDHLCFYVEDLEKETAKLEKSGFLVMYSVKYRCSGCGAVYFDTREVGGFFTELMHWAPGMIQV